jgi:hypothetical protein
MSTPNLEQTRAAATHVMDMQDADFNRRKSAEAGDPLIAMFSILARKLYPTDSATVAGSRVEVMLAAYFLRGDLDNIAVKAPNEQQARKAIDAVAALDGATLTKRMNEDVGDAVMAFFSAFSKKVMGQTEAKTVQLMVLAYLLRKDLLAA